MATFTITNNPTVINFAGGVTGVASRGTTYRIAFGGTWAAGDTFTFNIITAADTFVLGKGRMTGVVPTKALTLNDRVHIIAGTTWYGSENNDPTLWEQQNPGSFFINVSDRFKRPESLVSLAAYQGKMAIFGRWSISLWIIDPNPDNFSLSQVLANIGTFAPDSVESLGDLDVVFLGDTGFRSLRVRDISLNAFVGDIGSPLDLLVQPIVAGLTNNQRTGCVGVVEPNTGRYWCYIKDTLYVLSYFPSSKITAWSTYTMQGVISATLQTIVPSKFLVYNGQVYCRATYNGTEYIFIFGGTNGTTFDASVAHATIPFYDVKTPATLKKAKGFDSAFSGAWSYKGGMDYIGGTLDSVFAGNVPTFENGQMPVDGDGYFFQLDAITTGSTAAVLSSMIFEYSMGNEK